LGGSFILVGGVAGSDNPNLYDLLLFIPPEKVSSL